jgi:hypothetical protein
MSDDPLVIGGMFLFVGFVLNISSPHLSPLLDVNVGLWGVLFVIIGLAVIALRLRSMAHA